MPAGITNPAVGYVSFCVVKFVGYSLAARYISRSYGRSDIGALRVGATRTVIGMIAGAAYFGMWMAAQKFYMRPPSTAFSALPHVYLAGLLPVRITEWWLLIWIFYDRGLSCERLAHGRSGNGLVLRSRCTGYRRLLCHRGFLGLLTMAPAFPATRTR